VSNGRENRSTQRKPASVPLCPWQIPCDWPVIKHWPLQWEWNSSGVKINSFCWKNTHYLVNWSDLVYNRTMDVSVERGPMKILFIDSKPVSCCHWSLLFITHMNY
jgi:hypothetical protein